MLKNHSIIKHYNAILEIHMCRVEEGVTMMATKEGMCCHVHWVSYVNNESLNTTTKPNGVLYTG